MCLLFVCVCVFDAIFALGFFGSVFFSFYPINCLFIPLTSLVIELVLEPQTFHQLKCRVPLNRQHKTINIESMSV